MAESAKPDSLPDTAQVIAERGRQLTERFRDFYKPNTPLSNTLVEGN